MKKSILFMAAAAFGISAMAQDAPAFPGAEGHGRFVTGGRGGKVIHVTTLEDQADGRLEGSLRWALKQSGKKIIVFDVGGYIDLKDNLKVLANTTIAGQTAPGNGITLRYYTLDMNNASNSIVRFIRCRRSQVKNVNDGADAAWGRNNRTGAIIDHCSLSWSIDEVASFYDNRNFTLQWCNVAEGLANPGHSKGEHSYGGIWGGKGASFHHNFIAHVQNRSPRFCGARYNWAGYDKDKYANSIQAEIVDLRNCVIYNWGNGNGCYGGTGGGNINIVNNYYKAGPGTKNKTRVTQVSVATSGNAEDSPFMGYACRYFINGNYVAAAGDKAENYDWSGVSYDGGLSTINGERYIKDAEHLYGDNVEYVKDGNGVDCVRLKLDNPVDAGNVTTHDAQTAYERVLAYAGASLWRDAVDVRNAEEARTGTTTYTGSKAKTAGIIDLINDPAAEADPATASYPELASETRPADFDTDGDGIPNDWETANGLDPNNAADGALTTIDTKGWYTNVEVYINSLVENIMKAGNEGAVSSVDEYYPSYKSAGIGSATVSSEVSKIEYYTLGGVKVGSPAKGVSIRKITYTDGKSVVDKVIRQ